MAGWSQAIKVPVNQADDGPSGGWGNLDDRWDQSNSIHGEFTSLWPMIVLVQLYGNTDKKSEDAILLFQSFQGQTKCQGKMEFQDKTEF